MKNVAKTATIAAGCILLPALVNAAPESAGRSFVCRLLFDDLSTSPLTVFAVALLASALVFRFAFLGK